MTNDELDQVAQAIRDSCQLIDPDYPRTRRKLLRSIEIAALREALEIVEKAEKIYDFEGVPIRNPAAYDLETTISTLELK